MTKPDDSRTLQVRARVEPINTGDDPPELDEEDEIALDKAMEKMARDMVANPAKYGKEGWAGLEVIRKHYGIAPDEK